jgi:hypothetical protein
LKLPARRREKIAEVIIGSLKEKNQLQLDELWAKEAEDRVAGFLAGKIRTVAGEKVLNYRKVKQISNSSFRPKRNSRKHSIGMPHRRCVQLKDFENGFVVQLWRQRNGPPRRGFWWGNACGKSCSDPTITVSGTSCTGTCCRSSRSLTTIARRTTGAAA